MCIKYYIANDLHILVGIVKIIKNEDFISKLIKLDGGKLIFLGHSMMGIFVKIKTKY